MRISDWSSDVCSSDLHRLVAVHFGHHDVDEGDIDPFILIEDGDPLLAALRVEHFRVIALKDACEGVDVPYVVIDDQNPGAGEFRDSLHRRAAFLIPYRPLPTPQNRPEARLQRVDTVHDHDRSPAALRL